MNTILSALKITLAAAVLAGGIAAAAPVMAQSGEPSQSFSIGAPQGGGEQPQMAAPGGQGQMAPDGGNYRNGNGGSYRYGNGGGNFNLCLSDREIIRGIRSYGFQRVQITDTSRRRAEVLGRWGRWDYLMSVDKCSGEVNIVDRFRRGQYGNGTGFGLQFNFGN